MGQAKWRQEKYADRAHTVGGHYVLIIEWLDPSERQTGTELASRIERYGSEVVLATCKSSDDVFGALDLARDRLLKNEQFPFVHFEAHGAEPPPGGSSEGMVGPAGELLTWKSLAPRLGAINRLVGFRLVVIGAACYGLATLNMFEIDQVAPFALVVGFNSTVRVGRLFDSMREFYLQMLTGGHLSVHLAVESANRELSLTEGELLVPSLFYDFAQQLVREFLIHELEPGRFASEAERLYLRSITQGAQAVGIDRFRDHYRQGLVRHLKKAVRTWFAMDEMPDTAVRFPIPVSTLALEIDRRYRVENLGHVSRISLADGPA